MRVPPAPVLRGHWRRPGGGAAPRCAQGAPGRGDGGVSPPGASSEGRRAEWLWHFVLVLLALAGFWTGLDCAVDPGMEYPWGPFRVALPTALLAAPGAAVFACAKLAARPCGLEGAATDAEGDVRAAFVGDSLTHGSLSANYLEELSERFPGRYVNCGMNMRPAPELLEGTLLEDVAALQPRQGVAVLIGTNDLIRYTLLPPFLRRDEAEWLAAYAATLEEVVQRLQVAGVRQVALASAPLLGEDPSAEAGRLGRAMALAVRRTAEMLPRCRYAPLYEATVSHLEAGRSASSPPPRAYGAGESFALLCALPWRLYAVGQSLEDVRRAHGLALTVDLVHFGPAFAEVAARVCADALMLDPEQALEGAAAGP